MPATSTQKLTVLFRDNDIRCQGVPEMGIKCGHRIESTKDGRCDARLGDWIKQGDQERHPTDELRWLCNACDKIKTTNDQKMAAKDKRIRKITKNKPKQKIPSRPFPKKQSTRVAAHWEGDSNADS